MLLNAMVLTPAIPGQNKRITSNAAYVCYTANTQYSAGKSCIPERKHVAKQSQFWFFRMNRTLGLENQQRNADIA